MRIQLLEEEDFEEPLINLTPLIDVVFVVLIAFMILAPMLDIDRVQLAPGSPASKEQPSSTANCSITVRADNTIWVEQQSIALSDLKLWLQKEKKSHPHTIPRLIHDSRASFGTYQAIKTTVESCGFEELDVLLQPQ